VKYLLDTNTCIRYLNGRSDAIRNHFATVQPDDIVLCSVVKAELFYGARKSARPAQNLQHQQLFVSRFVSLPFDDLAANAYSRIRADLEKMGQPNGPNDLLIAAIALTHDLILVTHNTREFGRVPELQLVDWEIR
jgi:tRNA(fMet)-specific endonuclease VapC